METATNSDKRRVSQHTLTVAEQDTFDELRRRSWVNWYRIVRLALSCAIRLDMNESVQPRPHNTQGKQ